MSTDDMHGAADPAEVPRDSSERHQPGSKNWDGPTYYGRSQLKASPFNEWLVGGYIFLGGLSGAAALLATVADVSGRANRGIVRHGRYLSLLAPVLGAPLLILDLHTPKRFYNMLRVAKRTSPMSIGTWILMGFSGAAGLTAAGEFLGRVAAPLRVAARAAQWPAALTGAGLATYTATLLSATSTPFWAAAPRALAVRFGASSIAAGAASLALLEKQPGAQRSLRTITALALAAEFLASRVSDHAYEATGIADARHGAWGRVEKFGASGAGVLLPLGLLAAATLTQGRGRNRLNTAAALATIAGSALLKTAIIGVGDDSARRPDISFRFSQPENLPDKAERQPIREKLRRILPARNRR